MCKKLRAYLVFVCLILMLGQACVYAMDKPSIVSLQLEGDRPIIGKVAKFKVEAIGENILYEWNIYKNNKLINKQSYSDNESFSYNFDKEGIYKIQVVAKDLNGQLSSMFSEEFIISDILPIINSINMDKSTNELLGSTFNINANCDGRNLNYEWIVYKDSNIVFKKDYSVDNLFAYTPNSTGKYKFVLNIKDELGRIYSKESDVVTIYKNQKVDTPVNNNPVKPIYNSIENEVNSKKYSSKTNNFIYVDTKDNKVYIFEGKQSNWKLISAMPCTDGKKSTPTIKGDFDVKGRGLWLTSYSLKSKAKYKVNFAKGYYFHSILFDSKGEKIIDSRLGQSLSQGCIRLSIDNAKWIYDNIKNGTAVHIE